MLTSKNLIFNGSLFANSETVIGFMATKWVWEWFWILIPSPVSSAHKMRQTLTVNFIVYLEKCNFLQTTSNIGKLYIVEKYFSSWVWIRNRYLKIRLRLAQINLQSLSFLHGNACLWSGHFLLERRIPFWRGGRGECVGTLNRWWRWPERVVQCREATA